MSILSYHTTLFNPPPRTHKKQGPGSGKLLTPFLVLLLSFYFFLLFFYSSTLLFPLLLFSPSAPCIFLSSPSSTSTSPPWYSNLFFYPLLIYTPVVIDQASALVHWLPFSLLSSLHLSTHTGLILCPLIPLAHGSTTRSSLFHHHITTTATLVSTSPKLDLTNPSPLFSDFLLSLLSAHTLQ